MRMADPRSHEGERGPSGPAGQPRGAAIMSVWLEQARSFPNGVVATPHYLASSAGLAMLASGGNAVDAALAANLVLGVVTPYMCGVGGDLLATVWDGDVQSYRGVGRSPAGATLDAVRAQSGSETMPTFGPHPCTVPGAVDGWFTLLERWGTRSFGEVSAAARRYASDGFPLTRRGAWFFARNALAFEHFGLHDFTNAYGTPTAGSWVRQPALGRTLQVLADDGPDAYYRGPIGTAIAERLQRAGGFLTSADIAAHEGAWVEPLRATVRRTEILELPPPTQGIAALEALRIAHGLDLGPDGPDREHLLIESMKLALADRDAYLGDPAAMTVDCESLLAEEWIADRR